MAVVEGVKQLVGAPIQACDLRAGAALVIAGLAAQGTTELSHINYIERGYEDLVGKLRAVGADISLVDVPDEADTETHAGCPGAIQRPLREAAANCGLPRRAFSFREDIDDC